MIDITIDTFGLLSEKCNINMGFCVMERLYYIIKVSHFVI